MAVKTAISLSEAWSCDLNLYVWVPETAVQSHQGASASMGFLDGSATLSWCACGNADPWYMGNDYTAIVITDGDDSQGVIEAIAALRNSGPQITGFWYCNVYKCQVSAGMTSDYDYVAVGWLFDDETGQYTWYGPNILTMSVSASCSGISAHAETINSVPDDRQLMDFTDISAQYTWFVDDTYSSTISASTPSGGISASSSAGLTPGVMTGNIGSALAISYAVSAFSAITLGTDLASVTSISWGGGGIDTTGLELYNPGTGTAPDNSQADWIRGVPAQADYWCVHNAGGGPGIYRVGSQTSSPGGWGGSTYAPYSIEFNPLDGKFDDNETYDITYVSPWIDWITPTTWEYHKFTGPETCTQFYSTWQFNYEYQKLLTTAIRIWVDNDWREQNFENVGAGDMDENDRTCGILVHPIDNTSCTGDAWWPDSLISVSHYDSINVLDPGGVTRPSEWIGTNGVTINPSDSDIWTIAANSTSPTVTRTLKTRYWKRLDRLSGGYTAGLSYNTNWPIINKANVSCSDDAQWVTDIPSEDITNWSNFSYLKITYDTLNYGGESTLKITYSVPQISDPCYTCAEHRWDEFDYSKTTYTLTYDVTIALGTNQELYVDLCANKEQIVPVGQYRMAVVEKIEWVLPDTTDIAYNMAITGLSLTLDKGDGFTRTEPNSHYFFEYKRPWDWINPDWMGFRAIVDGLDALEIDYGYTQDHTRYEKKLLHIQKSQHCPDTQLEDRLDYAKNLSRLVSEINFQEGFFATYNSPDESVHNMDSDDNKLSPLYWWDLRNNSEIQNDFDGAVCVGTYNVLQGLTHTLNFYKYPQGRIHGIALNKYKNERCRNLNGVKIYQYTPLNGFQFVCQVSTDAHGRYKSIPLLEKDKIYKIGLDNNTIYSVANAEYTTGQTFLSTGGVRRVMLDKTHGDVLWRIIGINESTVYVDRLGFSEPSWTYIDTVFQNSTTEKYDIPAICVVSDDNRIYASAYETEAKKTHVKKFNGTTWSDLGMNTIATDLANVDIDDWHGQLWVAGYIPENLYVRATSKPDLTAENDPVELIIPNIEQILDSQQIPQAPALSIRVTDDTRTIYVNVQTVTGIDTYVCQNIDDGFVKL